MKKSSGSPILRGVTFPLRLIKYIGLGTFFTIYYFVKFILDFFISLFKYTGKFFVGLCIFVYRFFFYAIKGLLFPFQFIVVMVIRISRNLRMTTDQKKAVRERKLDAKARKAELEREKIAEENKRRLEMLKKKEAEEEALKQKKHDEAVGKSKKNRDKDVYINENVKKEKKTINDYLNAFFASLMAFPTKIKKSFQNSTFSRNKRNKKDINRQALLIDFEGKDAEKSDIKLLYQYEAKNAEGKFVKGYFEAYSKVEVHSFLLSEGYEVYSIKTSKWIRFAHSRSAATRTKIKNKDLIFFLTQLSTYIKAGIPLVDSLKILSRQYKNKNYQRIFRAIIYDLTMGDNFSDALTKQGMAFPKLLINMVKASEMTGELPEVLDDMSDYFTEIEKTRKQMITALMYPSLIFVFAIGVITFILMFVIPKFVDIYESMDASKIPDYTRFIISISRFLEKNIIWLFIGIFVFIIIMRYLYQNVKSFRTIMQWLGMHLPIFGNIIIYNEVTVFTKTFSSLLSHNVFITDSMEILNKITNNEIYKMLILDTITNLARGEKISKAFEGHWAFPIPAYEMLVTGEKTGELPEMMAKVSDYYQEMHRNAVARVKTFIEPVLIIFLTVVVGGIILAVIIPMFGMYNTIEGFE